MKIWKFNVGFEIFLPLSKQTVLVKNLFIEGAFEFMIIPLGRFFAYSVPKG